MSKATIKSIQLLLACLLVYTTNRVSYSALVVDTFESGTVGSNISTAGPWRVNDSGLPAQYRSTANPFPTGAVYGHINDVNTTQGTRLMTANSSGTGSLSSQISGKVTTYSFDFYETSPDVNPTDGQPGLSFGYVATGQQDLNSAGRVFRAALHDGLLTGPDGIVSGSGGAVAYARDTVHTVWMVANDSPVAVPNYVGSETLDPAQADVWISLAGATPVLAFALPRQNVPSTPQGIGFRSFNLDVQQFYIDNVLLVSGATLDRSELTAVPESTALAFFGASGALAMAIWKRKQKVAANATPPADVSSAAIV